MKKRLFDGSVRFEQVKGVGTVQIEFLPKQRVYTLIGENGVGKTKFLECLFTFLFLLSKDIHHFFKIDVDFGHKKNLPFQRIVIEHLEVDENLNGWGGVGGEIFVLRDMINSTLGKFYHDSPIVYLGAQKRGVLDVSSNYVQNIGTFSQRNKGYLEKLLAVFQDESDKLKSFGMDVDIEEWIIQRAQSANPYQAKEDNRKIEIDTLLFLLHQIDERIDPEFLEISGGNRVFIRIENQKRELSELSSGFTSILKIIQSIIAGYSYFTNEQQIARVHGVVLIDEIESHLHNEWQVKIVPLLKKLFPNTTFFITTHSSLVISQLEQGEAYRLKREADGVVYGKAIDYPSNLPFVDLLNEAFGVDLNRQKIDRAHEHQQKEAKAALLKLVKQELANIEVK